MNPTALIAEDEPLLARALAGELAKAWPQLHILATVGDGISAVEQALARQPDVLFFDIRMPGLNGLEAAAQLADAWWHEPVHKPFPALVFVTAYDQYAVQAFEAQAVDYLLKPVQYERLAKTVSKVQSGLLNAAQTAINLEANSTQQQATFETTLAQLRNLLAVPTGPALSVIQASVGQTIRLVPVGQVLYFEAADKYVRVVTASAEYLIRTPLKDLLPQLDAQQFWQIHRGTVVQAQAIDSVSRDEAGKQYVTLRGRPDKLLVSRLYAHLFRAL
jgi:DNA-binding LytR/AlgR family response regulator